MKNRYLDKIAEVDERLNQIANKTMDPINWVGKAQKALAKGPKGLLLAKAEKMLLRDGSILYSNNDATK